MSSNKDLLVLTIIRHTRVIADYKSIEQKMCRI